MSPEPDMEAQASLRLPTGRWSESQPVPGAGCCGSQPSESSPTCCGLGMCVYSPANHKLDHTVRRGPGCRLRNLVYGSPCWCSGDLQMCACMQIQTVFTSIFTSACVGDVCSVSLVELANTGLGLVVGQKWSWVTGSVRQLLPASLNKNHKKASK